MQLVSNTIFISRYWLLCEDWHRSHSLQLALVAVYLEHKGWTDPKTHTVGYLYKVQLKLYCGHMYQLNSEIHVVRYILII